jgi:CRP-like cAMP-binding protein
MAISQDRVKNRLLGRLASEGFAALAKDLVRVDLPKKQIVYEVGSPLDQVYFVEEGLVSVLTMMEDGASSEVGMVGPEGLIGVSALLGGKVSAQYIVVQLPGSAYRIAAATCKAVFDDNPRVRAVLLRFVEDLLNLSAQTAACNRLHQVEQRTARWLLMSADRTDSAVLRLTQEFLAAMLGVRRSGISEAASELQRSGLIRYRRGEITIVDRRGLADAACECYDLDRQRIERLM